MIFNTSICLSVIQFSNSWCFKIRCDKNRINIVRVFGHMRTAKAQISMRIRSQNQNILHNVWMESKGPDDNLSMRVMIWICAFCAGSKAVFLLVRPINCRICLEDTFFMIQLHLCYFLHVVLPSKHVYMGPIWAESGHLSHSGPAWAPYRLFAHIRPI